MRIVYETNGYLPDLIGGVEVLSARLIDRLRDRGHEVLVLTSCIGRQPPGRYTYEGVDIVKVDFGETLLSNRLDGVAALQREVNALIGDFRPDLLHLNDGGPSSFFLFRRGPLGVVPRVLTLHSPIRPTNKRGLLNRLADDANIVVAVSQALADCAAKAMPEIRRKLEVIRNALPPTAVRPAPSGRPVFVCVGRVVADKGMNLAIEALAILRKQGLEAELIIVGDGPHLRALEVLAESHGVRDVVQFRGWMMPQDVPHAINDASVVLVPSIWEEPFGLVALEAAWMGRPVIASRIGGLPEIVVHGDTGFLVSPNDAPALGAAMAVFLRAPDLATRMGSCARRHVENAFDFEAFVAAYERTYEHAVSNKEPAFP